MSSHPAIVNGGNQEIAPARARRVRAPGARPERFADFHWEAHQIATYARKSALAREERLTRRARDARRRADARAEGVVLEPIPEGTIREAADRILRIERRLRDGFVWKGGCVGGNPAYPRAAFVHPGLVSSGEPILQAFVGKLRRRKNLRVGGRKSESYQPDSKLEGLDEPYVEDNSKVCGVVRIETDHVLTRAAVAAACRASGAPLPNIVVGWRDPEGAYYRPHLLWLLHDSVPLEGEQNLRFLRLYRGVLRGLTSALLGIGADPGGLLNSHRHKNPLSPLWDRDVLAGQPYDLGALKAAVDVTVRLSELAERAAAQGVGAAPAADHPDPAVSTGSNAAFRQVAAWAKEKVGPLKAIGCREDEFNVVVAEEACRMAAELTGDAAKSEPAALSLAARVARWTWNVYRAPQPKGRKLAGDELKAALAEGGRKVCSARKGASFEVIGWGAQAVLAEGGKLRQAAVLDLVRPHGVTSLKTVGRHWDAVRLALAENRTFATPSVKKDPPVLAGPCEGLPLPPMPGYLPGEFVRMRSPPPAFLTSPYVPRQAPRGIPAMPEAEATAPPEEALPAEAASEEPCATPCDPPVQPVSSRKTSMVQAFAEAALDAPQAPCPPRSVPLPKSVLLRSVRASSAASAPVRVPPREDPAPAVSSPVEPPPAMPVPVRAVHACFPKTTAPEPPLPRYPSLECQDMAGIIRVYAARGERRPDIARATALALADITALLGPEAVAKDA